jgi:hypothetical protein
VRLPSGMRLAAPEREALWKKLERFVNCGGGLQNFQALGHAFPGLWPVSINYSPDSDAWPPKSLEWHPACHELFLCYRDALQAVWKNSDELAFSLPEFLLGLTNWNTRACDEARYDGSPFRGDSFLGRLRSAWWQVLTEVPTAVPTADPSLGMLWKHGEFCLHLDVGGTGNDFRRAFYSLFRQSWRARVCPSCKVFFVARRAKQSFCGTACSAGSRLASKRRWWHNVGTTRRASQGNASSKRNHRERKR